MNPETYGDITDLERAGELGSWLPTIEEREGDSLAKWQEERAQYNNLEDICGTSPQS